jgi:hypothetical protein
MTFIILPRFFSIFFSALLLSSYMYTLFCFMSFFFDISPFYAHRCMINIYVSKALSTNDILWFFSSHLVQFSLNEYWNIFQPRYCWNVEYLILYITLCIQLVIFNTHRCVLFRFCFPTKSWRFVERQ